MAGKEKPTAPLGQTSHRALASAVTGPPLEHGILLSPGDRELCSWASLPCPGRQEATAAWKQGLRPPESSPPSLPPYSCHQEPPCFSIAPAGLGHPDSLNCHTWAPQHKGTLLKSHPSRKKPHCISLHWRRITCLLHAYDSWKDTGTGVPRSVHTREGKRGENISPPLTLHSKITKSSGRFILLHISLKSQICLLVGPVDSPPTHSELLSSWMHRLQFSLKKMEFGLQALTIISTI